MLIEDIFPKHLEKFFLLMVFIVVTKLRNKMKGGEIPFQDKINLCKRAVIESVNDELRVISQIEHTRHRSFINFITNLIAGLLVYSFLLKNLQFTMKEMINFNFNYFDSYIELTLIYSMS